MVKIVGFIAKHITVAVDFIVGNFVVLALVVDHILVTVDLKRIAVVVQIVTIAIIIAALV